MVTNTRNTTVIYLNKELKIVFGSYRAKCIETSEPELDYLSAQEKSQYYSYKFKNKRQTFLSGRTISKEVLGYVLPNISPHQINILKGIHGHPIVNASCAHNVKISLTHCKSHSMALSFSEEYPTGIDLEYIDEKNSSAILSQMTNYEKVQILTSNFAQITLLTAYWTLKESLSKALLTGLLTSFYIFEIESMQLSGDILKAKFTNFTQFVGYSFIIGDFVFSIVLPETDIQLFGIDYLFRELIPILYNESPVLDVSP